MVDIDNHAISAVLIVEDNHLDSYVIQQKLKKSKFSIGATYCVDNLHDAGIIIAQYHIDIVILDLYIKDSAGLETIDKIRTIYDGAIIVLTNVDKADFGIETMAHGADNFINKNNFSVLDINKQIPYAFRRKKILNKTNEIINKISTLERAM